MSHCVAINSVDDFLTDNESDDKDIISTEGCFALILFELVSFHFMSELV